MREDMALKLKKGKLIMLLLIVLLVVGYVYREEVSVIFGNVFVDVNATVVRDVATEADVEAYETALEENDVVLCRALTFNDFRLDCIKQVAVALKSLEICESIEITQVKHGCFTDLSAGMNNVTVCEEIKDDEYWSDICYHNYAVANNDTWYCLFIEKGVKNNPCYYDVAVNTNDWELCEEVTDSEMQTRCNYVISKNALVIQPCLQMAKLLDRDVCILRLARNMNDVEVCDKIEFYPNVKEDCIKNVEG